jgi:hypothetical protein
MSQESWTIRSLLPLSRYPSYPRAFGTFIVTGSTYEEMSELCTWSNGASSYLRVVTSEDVVGWDR